jgi:hypothetical protein
MRNSDFRRAFLRYAHEQKIAVTVNGYGAFTLETQQLFDIYVAGIAYGLGNGFVEVPPDAFDSLITEDLT